MKPLNTVAGLLGSRLLGRPFYARFHVSYRCNYHCGMCNVHTQADAFPELAPARIAVVAERLRGLGARHLVLTGGEPFLRRDLPEIVALFARQGFSVRIQTNGGPQVTREALAAVAAAGARDVSVSVDTLDPAVQDGICGARGVLANATRTLELSRELLPRGISLANIVASRRNFAELPALVEHFHRRGIYSYITPVMIRGGGGDDAGGAAEGDGWPDFRFRSADGSFALSGLDAGARDAVIDALVALRLGGWGLTNSVRHLEDFRCFLGTGRSDWRCDAGRYTVDVLPDGRVAPCKEKPPVADILAPDFPRFARSREYRERVRATTAGCAGCFYGEYREPSYAVRDPAVQREWLAGWLRVYRRGMCSGLPPGPGR